MLEGHGPRLHLPHRIRKMGKAVGHETGAAHDPEDLEMLEDLIVAAVNQARERAQEVAEEKMREATGGMLPGLGDGLKIPGLIP